MIRYSLLLFFLSILLQASDEKIEQDIDSLFHMAHSVEKEELHIKEWQVTYRDQVNEGVVPDLVGFFNDQEKLDIEQNEHGMTYRIEDRNQIGNVNYSLILPKNSHDSARLIVHFSGVKWKEKEVIDFIRKKERIIEQFFSNSTAVFTCITAEENGIMKNGNSVRKIEENLNLVHMFTQFDDKRSANTVKEYYGYNRLWKDKIPIGESHINVQIVIKHNEYTERNLVTIGTPIILNEY